MNIIKPDVDYLHNLHEPVAKILLSYVNDMDNIPKFAKSLIDPIQNNLNQAHSNGNVLPNGINLSKMNVVPLSIYNTLFKGISYAIYLHYKLHVHLYQIGLGKYPKEWAKINDCGWRLIDENKMTEQAHRKVVLSFVYVTSNWPKSKYNDQQRIHMGLNALKFTQHNTPKSLNSGHLVVLPDKDVRLLLFAYNIQIGGKKFLAKATKDDVNAAMWDLSAAYPKLCKKYQPQVKSLFNVALKRAVNY